MPSRKTQEDYALGVPTRTLDRSELLGQGAFRDVYGLPGGKLVAKVPAYRTVDSGKREAKVWKQLTATDPTATSKLAPLVYSNSATGVNIQARADDVLRDEHGMLVPDWRKDTKFRYFDDDNLLVVEQAFYELKELEQWADEHSLSDVNPDNVGRFGNVYMIIDYADDYLVGSWDEE